jgi:hypothetical protein
MKTAGLRGQLLNYWTARALGMPLTESWRFATDGISAMVGDGIEALRPFCPVTDMTGSVKRLFEREGIEVDFPRGGTGVPGEPCVARVVVDQRVDAEGNVVHTTYGHQYTGLDRNTAGLRAYVSKHFGPEVSDLRV